MDFAAYFSDGPDEGGPQTDVRAGSPLTPGPEVSPDSARSPSEQETQAITEVHSRLAKRFPTVDDTVIEAAIRLEHSHLDGPIRDFVPILVEHAARDRIAAFTDRPPAPSATDDVSTNPDPPAS